MKEKKANGKIELHGSGMGLPSNEDIEKRAREIALIDERNPDDFTDADWKQAREELMGIANDDPPEETAETQELTEEWQVVAGSKGRRAPSQIPEEHDSLGADLVDDGREEAARDQMLEARREEQEQEGGIT